MTTPTPNILIVGSGAIGSFYGAILARAGCRVSVVVRSEYEAVARDGIRIDSGKLGDLSFRPAAVYREVSECRQPPDYLLLCVKVLEGVDRAALIRPAVGEHTRIVLIENGIDIEAEIAEAFPRNPLVSALAFVGVSRTGPGKVVHKAYGRLVLGGYPEGRGEAALAFSELLESGGIAAPVSDDVVRERWIKCIWNAAFNPVSVLGGGADTRQILEAPEGEAHVRLLMEEVAAIAAAAGYALPEDYIPTSLENTRKMPAYHNSMALDYLNGRPLETEAILGNAIRVARRLKVAVPHLETVYALMKLRERVLGDA